MTIMRMIILVMKMCTCPVALAVSARGSDCSSSSSQKPQPQPKKYRRVATHSPAERVVDVDAMSSHDCPIHMLIEVEYNIRISN